MGRTRLVGLAAAMPLVLMLAACSSAAATPSPTTAAVSAAPSVAAPSVAPSEAAPSAAASGAASPSEAAAETYEVKAATGTVAGASATFLTGEDGKTLYIFKKDTPGNGKSACGAGTCSDNWPAFTVDDASQLKADSGVTGKLATITRDDGKLQVTYNGAPLYYFAGDTVAGTTNGAAIPNWAVANP